MKTISHPLELTNQITERGLMVFDNVSKMPIYDKPFTSPFIVICLNHQGWLKTNFDMQIVEFHAQGIQDATRINPYRQHIEPPQGFL